TESVRLHPPLLPVLGDRSLWAGGAGWQAPPLDELRLHQSTVWRWNRAIYDPALGGHLRIEMRALPAGPTVIDMLANAAFLIGLSLWLAGQDQQWTYALPFERADHGFYRAAQQGLSAQLSWPAGHRDQIRTLAAAKLVAELVPAAKQGLLQAGVAAAEADGLLEVIPARAASGQPGAVWQRATLAAAERRHDRERALAVMLDRYLQCADTGLPVHALPVASSPMQRAIPDQSQPGVQKVRHGARALLLYPATYCGAVPCVPVNSTQGCFLKADHEPVDVSNCKRQEKERPCLNQKSCLSEIGEGEPDVHGIAREPVRPSGHQLFRGLARHRGSCCLAEQQ